MKSLIFLFFKSGQNGITDLHKEKLVRPDEEEPENRVLLMISIIILLAGSFALRYVGHTYFADEFFEFDSPGFWLLIGNVLFSLGILFFNKKALGWTWSQLGLSRPKNWWEPLIVTVAVFAAVILIIIFLQPIFTQWGSDPNVDHLMVLRGNLPLLLISLVIVWITSALITNLVFMAFLINSLDILLGRNQWSPWVAMILSALTFGLMHAWQGFGGMLTTATIGLVFGSVFLLNNRRIWAIILAHGLIDMLSLYSIYNM